MSCLKGLEISRLDYLEKNSFKKYCKKNLEIQYCPGDLENILPLRPRNTLSRRSGNYPAYNIWEYLVQRIWVIATMKSWDYHDWKIR
jgi:hypothetical protein